MLARRVTAASALLLVLSGTAFATDWQRDAIENAVEFHASNRPQVCNAPDDASTDPVSHELQIGEDTAARNALLVEFPCQIGAYNHTAVYLLSDQHGKVSEVVFPSPKVDVTYVGAGENAPVKEIVIGATQSLREVVNPVYDAASRAMTERNKWRGIGDAYTLMRWGFKNGRFEIMYLAVDASFDGRDNPKTMVERDIW